MPPTSLENMGGSSRSVWGGGGTGLTSTTPPPNPRFFSDFGQFILKIPKNRNKKFQHFFFEKRYSDPYIPTQWILTVIVDTSLVSDGGSNNQEDFLKTGCLLLEVHGASNKAFLHILLRVRSNDRQRRPFKSQTDPALSFFLWGDNYR